MSREGMALLDLYDLQHQSKARRKPKAYPRPWPDAGEKKSIGQARSAADLQRLLASEWVESTPS